MTFVLIWMRVYTQGGVSSFGEYFIVCACMFRDFTGDYTERAGLAGAREEFGTSGVSGPSKELPSFPEILSIPPAALLLHQREGGGPPLRTVEGVHHVWIVNLYVSLHGHVVGTDSSKLVFSEHVTMLAQWNLCL